MNRRLVHLAALSLTLVTACFLIGSSLQTTTAQEKGLRRLEFDPSTGHLSLDAEGASVSAILRQLKVKHGVEVTVPNMAEQEVTVKVDAPLSEALARLLPAGTRFHFVAAGGELKLRGQTGEKKTGHTPPKDGRLTTKDQPPTRPAGQPTRVKPAPNKVRPLQTDGRPGTKGFPTEAEVPGTGAKKLLPPTRERVGYARLNLSITRAGEVRVLRYMEVRGALVQPTTVDGDLIYTVSADGKVVAVGSVTDPLAVHSYLPDEQGHSNDRAESGTFLISLPESFLDPQKLSRTTLSFYSLSASESLPAVLTPQTFAGFKEYLKHVGKVDGQTLMAAYAKRYQRRISQ